MPKALTALNMIPVTGASHAPIGYRGCYLGYRPFSYHHHDLNPNKAVRQPMGFTYERDSQVHRYPGQPASQRPRCRMRTVFTDSQTKDLEQLFEITDYPGVDARAELAINSGLTEETVRVWFKNRRARRKRQRNGNKVNNSPTCSRREVRDGSPNCRSRVHQETALSAFL
ncbi:dharma [Osmerus eperlanus]|uniref:dharma n=1 Tax=Osmerus eperlanus TaxID=29151 RepID=UPI002E12BA26